MDIENRSSAYTRKDKEMKKKTTSIPHIYICSKIHPDAADPDEARVELENNLKRAKAACKVVTALGGVPICSAVFCTQFLNENDPADRAIGLMIGRELLRDADELWIFSREISDGMMAEIRIACKMGIPIRSMGEPDETEGMDDLEVTDGSDNIDDSDDGDLEAQINFTACEGKKWLKLMELLSDIVAD